MATQDRWNMWGQQWLASLKDMADNAIEDPECELTQFEKNLMAQLESMVVRPEDEKPEPEPDPKELALIAGYRQLAADFFADELDENEWDIDDAPTVSLSDHGAYVQLWRWFAEEDEDDS